MCLIYRRMHHWPVGPCWFLGIGVRGQKFAGDPLWIPSPTEIQVRQKYHQFEGFKGPYRAPTSLKSFWGSLRGLWGASEGLKEPLRASASLWGLQQTSEGLRMTPKTHWFQVRQGYPGIPRIPLLVRRCMVAIPSILTWKKVEWFIWILIYANDFPF